MQSDADDGWVLLYVHSFVGLLGTGAQDGHSTFTQLLSSGKRCDGDDVGLHVLGCRFDILGTNCSDVMSKGIYITLTANVSP